MDVMGRALLSDGQEMKIVTGIDDHSRFVVCARAVVRATARPVGDALVWALGTYGVPEQPGPGRVHRSGGRWAPSER